MKIAAGLFGELAQIPERARAVDAAGFDAGFSSETNNDPFLAPVLAAPHTKAQLFTAIAVALARSPMTVAHTACDLQTLSGGRFALGLGSQIEAHITKRFGMPWDKPVAQMREFVQALHTIWDCWYDEKPLRFEGQYYRHTLMTPMFTPKVQGQMRPKIYTGGVGPLMTQLAGEVADGFIAHGFTSSAYMRAVTLPAIEKGLAKSGRLRADIKLICPVMVVAGETEQQFIATRERVRSQLAFYGSTPAYRAVLEFHGWGALQDELNSLSKQGRWAEMAQLIDDDVLNTLAVVSENMDLLPERLLAEYGDLIDCWMCTAECSDSERQRQINQRLQQAS